MEQSYASGIKIKSKSFTAEYKVNGAAREGALGYAKFRKENPKTGKPRRLNIYSTAGV